MFALEQLMGFSGVSKHDLSRPGLARKLAAGKPGPYVDEHGYCRAESWPLRFCSWRTTPAGKTAREYPSRKAWLQGGARIGVVGPQRDL